ncbi:MAG: hypothetical protein EPN84_09740 [Legionella sp.]|nr:MAG: hypothetical protein EPN84_09740 [Legionella sp.]
MSKVTYFGIFHNEILEFLNDLPSFLADAKQSSGKNLKEWLFEEGFDVYRNAQSAEYRVFVAQNLERYKHRPMISSLHMKGQHYTGLTALKDAIVKEFALNNHGQELILTNRFDIYVLNSIERHKAFIHIEADVASDFHLFIDESKVTDPVKLVEKSIELFEQKQSTHPELKEEFNFKLTTMREYLENMPKPKAEETTGMVPR